MTQEKLSTVAVGTLTDEAVDEVIPALEALLFVADEPLTTQVLAQSADRDLDTVAVALARMRMSWCGPGRGIHLVEVAGGWQFRSNPGFHTEILGLYESKPVTLSRAAMETLAIVAYRQPVTRAVVDEIRGVDTGGVLRTLTDLELIEVTGRMDDIGRPNLYGTTRRFLEFFGLEGLEDLPSMEEMHIELDLVDHQHDELEPLHE